MSVKLQHIFAYPWNQVTQAFWEKYPHPSVPHVKEALQSVPASLRPFSRGYDTFYAVEETVVDANNKILQLTTRNVTFSRVVQALTETRYEPIDQKDGKGEQTLLTTTVTVTTGRFPKMLAAKIENSLASHSLKNAHRGLIAMEEICSVITSRFS